nr:hypothetical protein [Candidatus Gracilibacteria bacterium]
YIDPQEIPDKAKVAKALAPILFAEEDFIACKEDYHQCPSGGVNFEDNQILVSQPQAQLNFKDSRTKEQLILAYEQDILQKISKSEIDYSPLVYGGSDELLAQIKKLNFQGIYAVPKTHLIYANPLEVPEKQINYYAHELSKILKQKEDYLARMLTRRPVRYVPLKRKISPEISEQIWALKNASHQAYKQDTKNTPHFFKGVVLIPEHWRYYPEKNLAASVIGYVDKEGIGRYGIEEKFQELLKGQQGNMMSKNDVNGTQLVFDINQMKEAVDGDSIVLTLDRVIQNKAEELLRTGVERYNADSGSIVIMEPFSGEIIAMANYPDFDPNNVGTVYEIEPYDPKDTSKWIYPTQPILIKDENDQIRPVNHNFLREEQAKIDDAIARRARGEKVIGPNGELQEIEIP